MSCAHQTWQYPVTERTNFQEVLHGQTIKDPYRWLENLNSAQTKEWVQKQKAFTNGYLEKLPHREKIKEKLVQLWNYEKYSAPIKRGKYYFYRHNTGLQNQSILYLTQDPKKKGKILIDPNKLSQDGTVALNTYEPSPHGNFIVYSVTQSGSDWKTWHLMEVASQKNLDDTIQWTKFTNISWSPDESGFYYTGYKAPKQEGKKHQTQTYFNKVYFHRLGTPQSQDQIIYDDPNTKDAMFDLQVSDDGTHLILEISKGTDNRNQVFIRPRKSNQNHLA